MTNQEAIDYYRSRESHERTASTTATCVEAKDRHFELAERYADVVWSIEEGHTSSTDYVSFNSLN